MKLAKLAFVSLLPVACLCGCTSQEEPTGLASTQNINTANGKQHAWNNWREEFNYIAATLELTEDEKCRLKSTYEEQAKIINHFWVETGKDLQKLEKQIKDAVTEKSLTKMRGLISEAKPIKRRFQDLLDGRERALLDALSPERRNQLLGCKLTKRFWSLTKSMSFSDEQKTKIKQLALDAAKASVGQTNPSAAGFVELEQMIEQQVLDTDQTKVYNAVKRSNKLRSLFK